MKALWYVLLYHDVSWEENPYVRGLGGTCPPDVFRDHLEWAEKTGELVSVREGLRRTADGDLRHPIFSFWFDDGLAGVRKYAYPLMKKHGVTGGFSLCSRFWNRQELFWRFQLSYLSCCDGLRFLRPRLRKLGFKKGMSVRDFTLTSFSEQVVERVNRVYEKFTSDLDRKDAFRLFDTGEGLLELARDGWDLANHTAAHYPVGEPSFIHQMEGQFVECEEEYRKLFGSESTFWVLPFDRPHNCSVDRALSVFSGCGGDRYLVFVRNRANLADNLLRKTIYRFDVPLVEGKDVGAFLRRGPTLPT